MVQARHFLATFNDYARNEGDALNDWDVALTDWIQNDQKWIATVLNLMEDEACTWALPHLERLATGLLPFSGSYSIFVDAFTKCFSSHNSTEVARDALKHLKQGKNSGVIQPNLTNLPTRWAGQMLIITPDSMIV